MMTSLGYTPSIIVYRMVYINGSCPVNRLFVPGGILFAVRQFQGAGARKSEINSVICLATW